MPAKNRRRNNNGQFQGPEISSRQSSPSSFDEQALVVAERTGSSSLSNTQYQNDNTIVTHHYNSQPGYNNANNSNATSNATPQSFDVNIPAGMIIQVEGPVQGRVFIPGAQQQPHQNLSQPAQPAQHGNSWFTTGSSPSNQSQMTNNGGGQNLVSSTCQACGADLNGCGHGNQGNVWSIFGGKSLW